MFHKFKHKPYGKSQGKGRRVRRTVSLWLLVTTGWLSQSSFCCLTPESKGQHSTSWVRQKATSLDLGEGAQFLLAFLHSQTSAASSCQSLESLITEPVPSACSLNCLLSPVPPSLTLNHPCSLRSPRSQQLQKPKQRSLSCLKLLSAVLSN